MKAKETDIGNAKRGGNVILAQVVAHAMAIAD